MLLEFGSERACAPPALSATRTHLLDTGLLLTPDPPVRSQDPSSRPASPLRRSPPNPQPARPPPRPPTPRQAKAQTTGRWSLKARAGSGSARGAGTRHPPEQGGPGEAAHTAAGPQQSQRGREREKVNADTHAPRGGKADGGQPQTILGRLRRVVLPVKRDCSAGNPNSAGDYSSCAPEE